MRKYEAEVRILVKCKSPEDARHLYFTLFPETISAPAEREKTNVLQRGDIVEINILATDLSALRAAVNAYLRWVKIVEDIKLLLSRKEFNGRD